MYVGFCLCVLGMESDPRALGYGEVDLTGHVIAGPGTPMFHAHGVSLYSTAVCRAVN